MKERWLIDVYRVDIPDDTVDDISEATEDTCNRNRDYYVQVQGYSLKEVAERLMRSHEFEEMRKSNIRDQAPAEHPSEKPVIIVGLDTLAVLFQGINVNLDNALLIPDDGIRMAAVRAQNIKRPPMQETQNVKDQASEGLPASSCSTRLGHEETLTD